MDLLADLGENAALEVTAVLLLMAIWGGAIWPSTIGYGPVICGPSVQAETPKGKPGRDDACSLSRRVPGTAPRFMGRSFSITAEIEVPQGGAEGMLDPIRFT
jgi:hypothetical protein